MLKFVTDEDFNNRILRGLLHRQPDLDIVRLQDTHLAGANDAIILEWAFQEERVVLTHDVRT
jgi:predicted nuclease of predicted toxin-antitoxin system